MFCHVFFSNSQDAIVEFPERADGFLILNKIDYPTINDWRVVIKVRSINNGGSKISGLVEYSLNKPYTYVNEYLNDPDVFYHVFGISAHGDTVVEQGPINVPVGHISYSEEYHSWDCHSKTYAYKIQALTDVDASGTSVLQMTALKPDISTGFNHYYQWVDGSDWLSFVGNAPASHYGFPQSGPDTTGLGFDYLQEYNNPFSERIIRLQNVPLNASLYDAYGQPCSGTVWGIAKVLGDWNTGFRPRTDVLAGTHYYNLQLSGAMAKLNIYKANWDDSGNEPDVSCYNYSTGALPGGSGQYNGWADGVESIEWNVDGNYAWSNNYYNFGNWLQEIFDLFNPWSDNISPGNYGGTVNITNEHNVTLSLDYNNLFTEDGVFNGFSGTIGAGLNKMSISFNNGSYTSGYFYLEEEQDVSISLSDLVGLTVFPNPITENEFNITLNSIATLSFTYNLYDEQGNLIYSKDFSTLGDESARYSIEPNFIPSGIMLHRLQFEDGSVLERTTIRQ